MTDESTQRRTRPGVTILLAEDNRSDVFVIREILKHCGVEISVHIARDGDQALKFWDQMENDSQSPCPDLVLLDLNLPRVHGSEVLSRIRRSNRCPGVPVVIVTSSSSPEDMAAIRALNASAYFRKPSELSDYMQLGEVIREFLPAGESSGSAGGGA
jgi:CheY-like chemotaxis protein